MRAYSLALAAILSAAGLAAAQRPAPRAAAANSGAAAALQRAQTNPPAPIGPSGPAEPPEDLERARDVWGEAAQVKKLRKNHPAPETSFTFAVIGDSEYGRFFWTRPWSPGKDAFKKQLRAIQAEKPDLIMQLGDSLSKGTVKNYRAYVGFLKSELRLPLFHVIGNHDRSRPNGKADKTLFKTVFGDATDYFFDHNGWRFIALDSSDYRVTDAQLDWLDRTLDNPKKSLIFTHIVPAYLKRRLHSIGPKGILIPEGYFEEGSERFGKIVAKRKVTRVYMGHIHAFGIGEYEGVRYVLTGGGGSPLMPLPPGYPKRRKAHYLLINADASGIKETVHEMDGTVFPIP